MSVLAIGVTRGGTREISEQWAARTMDSLRSAPGFVAQVDYPRDGDWFVSSICATEAHFRAYFDAHVAPCLPAGVPSPEVIEVAHLVLPAAR